MNDLPPATRVEWTEEEAKKDLAINHFPGKWKRAQELGHKQCHYTGTYENYSYWQRVRLLYLELGGEYIWQLTFLQQLRYYYHPKKDTAVYV